MHNSATTCDTRICSAAAQAQSLAANWTVDPKGRYVVQPVPLRRFRFELAKGSWVAPFYVRPGRAQPGCAFDRGRGRHERGHDSITRGARPHDHLNQPGNPGQSCRANGSDPSPPRPRIRWVRAVEPTMSVNKTVRMPGSRSSGLPPGRRTAPHGFTSVPPRNPSASSGCTSMSFSATRPCASRWTWWAASGFGAWTRQ